MALPKTEIYVTYVTINNPTVALLQQAYAKNIGVLSIISHFSSEKRFYNPELLIEPLRYTVVESLAIS